MPDREGDSLKQARGLLLVVSFIYIALIGPAFMAVMLKAGYPLIAYAALPLHCAISGGLILLNLRAWR